MMNPIRVFLLAVSILVPAMHYAQIVAQWRGPERSGIYPDTALQRVWPADGPALRWIAEGIGKGYSSAVSDGRMIFVTGMKDSTDYLSALTMEGKLVWQIPFGRSWHASFPDTRTTPTVVGDLIYVVSGAGEVACINAGNGSVKWRFNGVEKFGAAYGDWGVCESPLVAGNSVIYTPAGNITTMVALDRLTGNTIWQSECLNDTSAYVSPRLISYAGKEIIVTITATWFLGVDASNGRILWKFDYAGLLNEESLKVWPGAPRTNTNTPLYHDGHLYITGGYNHVGAMFRLDEEGTGVTLVWTDTTLDCHHGGVVRVGDHIYGSNWINNARGNWCCIDWKSGAKLYETTWNTKGSIISANGMLYCFEEKQGNLALVRATPEKFDLVSSFRMTAGKGPYWAHPVIHEGILYLRHGDVLAAYDLRR